MSESEEKHVRTRRSTRLRQSTAKALDFEALKASKAERKSQAHSSPASVLSIEDSEDEEFENVPIKDTVSCNTPLAGKEIYSFNKVKKHERLVSTPEQSKELVKNAKTPHHMRKELKKGIKSSLADESSDENDFEDSESEYSISNSSSDTESSTEDESEASSDSNSDSETASRRRKPAPTLKMSTKTKPAQTNQKYVIKTEEYFAHTGQKSTTSNHTLDKLKTPRLSQDQLQKLLAKMTLSKNHQKAVRSFAETARENFPKWLCLLHENFNILLYGLGSKRNILSEFQSEMLAENPVIVVNGFFPSLTLKEILDAIVHLLGISENANAQDTLDDISREMQLVDQHLYLIVHNIEGDMLRNNKSQNVLARLAAIPNVHLIASIDHINAPLIWDHNKLSRFNFVWFDVTSYLPYSDETSFESSMLVQRTGNLALSSLRNVFLSLTANSKGIYTIIIKYQLEHNINQYYQGMLFKDLYIACREAFLVSSDLALRAQLTEFVDHKMVKLKRAADGAEYLMIPIANNLLQQFLNEQK